MDAARGARRPLTAAQALRGLALASLVALALLGPRPAQATLQEAIRGALAALPEDAPMRAVRAAWQARGFAPRFVEPQPPFAATEAAREAVGLLGAATGRGLDPTAYRAESLRAALDAPRDERGAAAFEAALAAALARLYADAGFGRIDPRSLGYDLPQQRRRAALEPAVREALQHPVPALGLEAVEPTLPVYRPLVAALAEWRRRAAQPGLPPLPPQPRKVSPGDAWTGVDLLRERLLAEGDLDPAAAADGPDRAPGRYQGELVDAVRRFQARHGLEADGVIGAQTRSALDTPPAARVRSIELSLERLRWLGATPRDRYVAINIPEFRLWAVEDGRVATTMAVIVGRAVSGTPVFVDAIEAVQFNPYWNVPRSIAAKELHPKLARDPGWLAREHMELLGAVGGDLRAALASGAARLRQRPGVDNALGRVMFSLPNTHDVYLHDTPARTLFARSRRDFSHGCVRLERPLELARFVLAGLPDWTPQRMDAVIAEGRNQWVRVPAPVPVLIFYSTVNMGPDGRARFLPDVYGLDARLDGALRALERGTPARVLR
jgi:murein L,D-transpeptidase YcbB/YkuD